MNNCALCEGAAGELQSGSNHIARPACDIVPPAGGNVGTEINAKETLEGN